MRTRKEGKHDKTVLVAKTNLNRIEVLICMALIDSNIGHEELILINNL